MTKSHIPMPPLERTWDGKQIARLVHQAESLDPNALRAKERALAGTYRVIHGRVEIPQDWADWHTPDGQEIPGQPKTITARMGDIVELGDEDAARMLDADVVERLDAKPSRVGKVWSPPPPVPNRVAMHPMFARSGHERARSGGKL
jgi:hypothetical protein